MAKNIIAWPTSPVDLLVEQWAKRHGIDMRRDVMGYDLHRGANDLPTITLRMPFDEPACASGGPVVQRYLVGESGPEMTIPPETDNKE